MGEQFTALGVYIFAGGFTLGIKRAGFNVLAHFEDGEFGVASTKLNFPELPVYTDYTTWPATQAAGKVDLLYSNPPCAPWSQAGVSPIQHKRFEDKWYERDPRTECVHRVFNLLWDVRPKVWVWESVARAWASGRDMVNDMATQAIEQGYAISILLLNGNACGLPQHRKRMFFVAHNVAIDWQPPNEPGPRTVEEAWRATGLFDSYTPSADELVKCKFAREIIDGTHPGGELRSTWERLHGYSSKQTGTAASAPKHAPGRPAFVYKRLRLDRPANTATGGARHFHPIEPRLVSITEAKVLCGYPLDYQFTHKPNTELAFAQMAKAVLPPVAYWLGKQIHAGLKASQVVTPSYTCYDWLSARQSVISITEGEAYVKATILKSALPKATPTIPAATPALLQDTIPLEEVDQNQSGRYIKRLLTTTQLTDQEIVAQVHANFTGRKTTVSDVRWNKDKLRRSGNLPPVTTGQLPAKRQRAKKIVTSVVTSVVEVPPLVMPPPVIKPISADNEVEDTRAFALAMALPTAPVIQLPDPTRRKYGVAHLLEELSELVKADACDNLVELTDALLDIVWVAKHFSVAAGITSVVWAAGWQEVKRANMEKQPSNGSSAHKYGVIKPPGWRKPDIESVLRAYGWQGDKISK